MRALEAAKIYKPMRFSMLDITSGNHGLDEGCGNGDDVSALAGIVGKAGLVVGSDSREKLGSGEPLTADTWSKANVEGTISADAHFASITIEPRPKIKWADILTLEIRSLKANDEGVRNGRSTRIE